MQLLFTDPESNPGHYSHVYDIGSQKFIDLPIYKDHHEQVGRFKIIKLPKDLSTRIILQAFIYAVEQQDFDSAIYLLMISKQSHVLISKYFKVKPFKLFSILKLAESMIDTAQDNPFQSKVPMYYYLDYEAPIGRYAVGDLYFNSSTQLHNIHVAKNYYGNDIHAFCMGPSLLDLALTRGHFKGGVFEATMFAYPYMILRVTLPNGERRNPIMTREWVTLAKLLTLTLGPHFHLFLDVPVFGLVSVNTHI